MEPSYEAMFLRHKALPDYVSIILKISKNWIRHCKNKHIFLLQVAKIGYDEKISVYNHQEVPQLTMIV